MKVSTDGILLGAWSQTTGKKRALDIGTGTGLVALMLAQKAPSLKISALEIDADALSQAADNIANSPWHSQLALIDGDVIDWSNQTTCRFDLIVSNPPFFSDALKGSDHKRNLARHNDSLSFDQLLESAQRVATEDGVFDVILPMSERQRFLEACQRTGWFEAKLLLVSHNSNKEPMRFLSRLSLKADENVEPQSLSIREIDGSYSEDYKALCRDYYLKF